MAESKSCPNESQLQVLLDGTLSDESQAVLAVHLESCEKCRKRLESLAGADGAIPQDAPSGSATASRSEALAEAMRRLKAETADEAETMAGSSVGPPSLQFLSPSTNPRHLGRLAGYEILEVIGRGGMGTVLKARDTKLERLVAVKVLNPELGSSGPARARFLREARSAAAVTHEHVVTIHAVDEANEVPFLVMEYVVGVSLEDRIQQSGHLRVEEILRIGMQAASGLAAAHAQGLVHRDIKPANILLENGVERVKITDFGLVRVIHEAQLTESNVIAGTPPYMSPEQARGEQVDHRSDLFSLGCVLYAMCTGRSPFRADTPTGAIHRVCSDTPRPIREVNPDVPEWLVAIIDRLLAKDPGQRFQTAGEVAETLGQYLAHVQQPSQVQLPSPSAHRVALPRRRPGSRRRKIAAVVAAVCFAFAVLAMLEFSGVTGLWDYYTLPRAPEGYSFIDLRGVANLPLSGPTDKPLNNLSELPTGVQTLAGVPFFVDDRYVRLDGYARFFKAFPSAVKGMRVDRRTRRLHFLQGVQGVGKGKVTVAQYTVHYEDGTSEEIPVVNDEDLWDWWGPADREPPSKGREAWSGSNPDQRIAEKEHPEVFGTDLRITLYRTEWQNPHHEKKIRTIDFTRTAGPSPFCVAITCQHREGTAPASAQKPPESQSLTPDAELADTGTLSIHVPIKGIELTISSGINSRRFRRDERIEVASGIVNVDIVNLQNQDTICSGKLTIPEGGSRRVDVVDDCNVYPPLDTQPPAQAELLGHTGPVQCAAVSDDGTTLATASDDNSVKLWLAKESSFELRQTITGHKDSVTFLVFCPQSRTLASASRDGTVKLWQMDSEGDCITLPSHGAACTAIAFSSDGEMLAAAFADGTVSLWKWKAEEKVAELPAHKADVLSVVFSPDGSTLATSSLGSTIKIWDVATWQELRSIRGHTDAVESIAFFPDGKTLASAGRDTTVKLWDIESGQMVDSYVCRGQMMCVAVSADGKLVAASGEDQIISLWNTSDGRELKLQSSFHGHWSTVNSIAFSRDGRSLVTASSDHSAKVWDVADLPVTPDPVPVHPRTTFASGRKRTGVTEAWSMGSGASTAFTVDGDLLAMTDTLGQLRVWQLGDFSKIAEVDLGQPMLFDTLGFTPGGETLVACTHTKLHFWDRAKAEWRSSADFDVICTGITISPHGEMLVTMHVDGVTRLWDLDAREPIGEKMSPFGRPTAAAISQRRPLMLIGTKTGRIMQVDPTTLEDQGEPLQHGTGIIETIVFSPDGTKVATSSLIGSTIKLWDAVTLREIATLTGHKGCIQRIAFSPDGTSLVASGGARTGTRSPTKSPGVVTMWDMTRIDKGPIAQFPAHTDSAVSVVFSPDGKTLATTGRDGKVHLWDITKVLEAASAPDK